MTDRHKIIDGIKFYLYMYLLCIQNPIDVVILHYIFIDTNDYYFFSISKIKVIPNNRCEY